MNKHLKKYLSLFLLGIFTCPIVIDHKTNSMAIPVTVAMQQIPRILMTAGSCMIGIATSLWHTHNTPTATTPPHATTKVTTTNQHQASVASSIATSFKPDIDQVAKAHNTTSVPSTHSTVKTATPTKTEPISVEQAAVKISEHVASQEQKKLILNSKAVYRATAYTIPGTQPAIERRDLTNGVQYIMCDGDATLTLEWSDRSAQVEARAAIPNFSNTKDELRTILLNHPAERAWITKQLNSVMSCLVQTQSPDFITRLQARIAMQFIQLPGALADNALATVNDLNHLFFHYDGTICRKALHENTQACESIRGLIDWIDYQIGDIIPRDQYISKQAYDQLNANCSSNLLSYFISWCNAVTGRHCTMTQAMLGKADAFNADMLKCIEYSSRFEFKKAEQLRDTHKSGLLNDIIQYYKKVQIHGAQQKLESLYDEHGIIRIASHDPLYKQYKLELEAAPDTQKKIINQNLLVRYHLKNTMHEKWGIPQSAPDCVHDALYEIMGPDCSALSDISLVQERIEQIIDTAPENQRAQLIKAFYLPNGALKEYAQHDINVQTIKMTASILDAYSTDARQQLNTFIGMRIKNPQESAKINQAIECLQKSLNAKTEPERIKYKEQFDAIYNQIGGQPGKAKPVITPQSDTPPVAGAPVPPDPDEDKKAKEKVENTSTQNVCLNKVQWTNHGFKHFPPKNTPWKNIVSLTKGGAAKYHPSIEIEKIERLAWEQGKICTNGKPWKVMKFDKIVGAKNGIETNCIRVECSANTIHGHPITLNEYSQLIS